MRIRGAQRPAAIAQMESSNFSERSASSKVRQHHLALAWGLHSYGCMCINLHIHTHTTHMHEDRANLERTFCCIPDGTVHPKMLNPQDWRSKT